MIKLGHKFSNNKNLNFVQKIVCLSFSVIFSGFEILRLYLYSNVIVDNASTDADAPIKSNQTKPTIDKQFT